MVSLDAVVAASSRLCSPTQMPPPAARNRLPPGPPPATAPSPPAGTAAAAVQAVDVDSCDYSSEASEAITDLGNPASFFPRARALERTIVAHLG